MTGPRGSKTSSTFGLPTLGSDGVTIQPKMTLAEAEATLAQLQATRPQVHSPEYAEWAARKEQATLWRDYHKGSARLGGPVFIPAGPKLAKAPRQKASVGYDSLMERLEEKAEMLRHLPAGHPERRFITAAVGGFVLRIRQACQREGRPLPELDIPGVTVNWRRK